MQQMWFTALGVYIGIIMAAATLYALNQGLKIRAEDDAPWPVIICGIVPNALVAITLLIYR